MEEQHPERRVRRRSSDLLGVMRVERLIGWLSCVIGASALQPNDSVFFQLIYTTPVPYVWIASLVCLGLALVATTHTDNARCRIVLLILLALPWAVGLGLVLAGGGPLGAFGASAIVILAYITQVLWAKIHGSTA